MKKQLAYITAVAGILGGCATSPAHEDDTAHLKLQELANSKKRNVIFILTDDHRYDYMGFTGKVP